MFHNCYKSCLKNSRYFIREIIWCCCSKHQCGTFKMDAHPITIFFPKDPYRHIIWMRPFTDIYAVFSAFGCWLDICMSFFSRHFRRFSPVSAVCFGRLRDNVWPLFLDDCGSGTARIALPAARRPTSGSPLDYKAYSAEDIRITGWKIYSRLFLESHHCSDYPGVWSRDLWTCRLAI